MSSKSPVPASSTYRTGTQKGHGIPPLLGVHTTSSGRFVFRVVPGTASLLCVRQKPGIWLQGLPWTIKNLFLSPATVGVMQELQMSHLHVFAPICPSEVTKAAGELETSWLFLSRAEMRPVSWMDSALWGRRAGQMLRQMVPRPVIWRYHSLLHMGTIILQGYPAIHTPF